MPISENQLSECSESADYAEAKGDHTGARCMRLLVAEVRRMTGREGIPMTTGGLGPERLKQYRGSARYLQSKGDLIAARDIRELLAEVRRLNERVTQAESEVARLKYLNDGHAQCSRTLESNRKHISDLVGQRDKVGRESDSWRATAEQAEAAHREDATTIEGLTGERDHYRERNVELVARVTAVEASERSAVSARDTEIRELRETIDAMSAALRKIADCECFRCSSNADAREVIGPPSWSKE